MNFRKQSGINLITLSIAIVIMVIITSVLVYNTRDGARVRELNEMYNDIELLNYKISEYYLDHNALPYGPKYENLDFLNLADNNQINPNNGEDFYVIDLKLMDGITLNYGEDYDQVRIGGNIDSLVDLYIINEESHTIYYPRGVDIQGLKYYTEPDEWDEISVVNVPKKLNTHLTSSNYGDFIDYGIDISNDDENHINGWKIFYANNQGTYLIAADYVLYSNNILNNAMSAQNANIENYSRYAGTGGYKYSAYWPAETYFTHTVTKNSSGDAVINANANTIFKYGFESGLANNNSKAVASLLDTYSWKGFLADGATFAIGGPTLELLRASWNEKNYSTGNHNKIQVSTKNDMGYCVGINNDNNNVPSTFDANVSGDVAYNDSLYFPHKANFNNCDGYWLASPSAYGKNDLVYSRYNGGLVHEAHNYGFVGVRPVVFLPSKVKAVWDDTANMWMIER